MNIVFFGTPDLALPTLERLSADHTITAVVCQPDKPVGRKKTPQAPPVKVWAEEHGITVQQPVKMNDGAFESWLRDQQPDVCVLVAYGRILKQAVLDIPTQGFINVHPSLLPLYRGPSPIHTAVQNGDAETGVTIMRLDAGTDTGDIALQESVPLPENATTADMAGTLAELGAELTSRTLAALESNDAVFVKQDGSLATHTRMIVKSDGALHWEQRAEDLHNQARACVPWPVAYCTYNEHRLRIYNTRVIKEIVEAQPGVIVRIEDDALIVATGKYALAIHAIQAAGKKMMSIADYQRGNPFQVGEKFEDG
ncbi:MAG: methionyl-tRNA formyltransferase [Candidatus Hydrogenedentota bacterium]